MKLWLFKHEKKTFEKRISIYIKYNEILSNM